MNDDQKANALRIAAYLENRLSPEEREAFKRLLGEDDELRRQYVDALMNRAGTGQSASDAGGSVSEEETGNVVLERATNFGMESRSEDMPASVTAENRETAEPVPEEILVPETNHGGTEVKSEPANEDAASGGESGGGWHSVGEQGAREAWEAGWPGGKENSRIGFLGSRWMVGVTLLVLVIAAVIIFVLSKHHEFWEKTAANIAVDSSDVNKIKVDSAAAGLSSSPATAAAGKPDSSAKGNSGASGAVADTLFAKLYKPYTRGDDPIAVRTYYQDYRSGNYDAVFAAGDSLVTGPTAAKYPTRNYIRLYKGLSYLATGKAPDATSMLADVVLRTKPGDELYDAARWYLALAWLRRTDVDAAQAKDNALGLARDISHGYSRYRESAREMIKGLE